MMDSLNTFIWLGILSKVFASIISSAKSSNMLYLLNHRAITDRELFRGVLGDSRFYQLRKDSFVLELIETHS
jgi:hypothetical protein